MDVSVVYERMRCSKEFISLLHRRSVLTGAEYDELLCSLKTHPVSSEINKQLMDFINKKLPQVQELFTDQLCRYQTHLVMVDTEDTTFPGELLIWGPCIYAFSHCLL